MIPLSPNQRAVYDTVHRLTKGGTVEYVGKVRVEGVAHSTAGHALVQLAMLGLVESKPTGLGLRRVKLLIGPEGVCTVPHGEITRHRLAGRALRPEPQRLVDSGAFLEAIKGLSTFEDDPRAARPLALPSRFNPPHRADARAL
jgi:hypothetical protein